MSIKEENLIPYDGEIKAGQRLTKIGDTFVPVGIGSNRVPGTTIIKDIGKGIYYKCASVGNTTWSGNKAIQNEDGTWWFEDVVTSGLSFTEIKPEKGKVYSFDALVEVKLWDGSLFPTDGLIFHAPLSTESNMAETGQQLNTAGNVVYDTVGNIPCAYFDGGSYLYSAVSDIPVGTSNRTISLWLRANYVTKSYFMAYGIESGSQYFSLCIGDSYYLLGFVAWGNDHELDTEYDLTQWVNYTATYDGSNLKLYVNGTLSKTISISLDTGTSDLYIGGRTGGQELFNGYLAGCRIYDRVLTDEEILQLSQEFTPTA